jgi:PAS domain S-box-containing protein
MNGTETSRASASFQVAKTDAPVGDARLRAIAVLSALPAMWAGADPRRVAEILAATLFTTLDAEFVYVRCAPAGFDAPVTVAHTGSVETDTALAEQIGPAVLDWVRAHDSDELLPLTLPGRTGALRLATCPIGLNAELGVIAVAFAGENVPGPGHRLLLDVGATQAASALRNAHLLKSLRESEDRANRTTEELARRVAELEAANDEIWQARRAALNLMEDALLARETAENLNRDLQNEIAQRKFAEDALRQSEERFRAIVSHLSTGVAQTDLAGKCTFVNQRYCDMTGYTRDELLQMRMQDITHPDDLPRNLEQFQALVDGGPDFVIEKRYRRKDGSWVWVNNSVSAVRDDAGRTQSLVAVSLDITARKQHEQNFALLASLQDDFARLSTVSEIMEAAGRRIAAHLHLSRCLFVEVNESACEATVSYDFHAQGLHSLIGVHQILAFHTQEERRELAAGKPVVIDDVRKGRPAETGARFAALGIGSVLHVPYCSKGRWAFVVSAMHSEPYTWRSHERELLQEVVSRIYLRIERARAEAALRTSEEALRSTQTQLMIALSASETGTFRWNPHTGEFLAVGENFKRLFGASPEAPIRVTDDFLARVHSDDRPAVISAMNRCRTGADFEVEHRVVHPDGSIRWLYDRAKLERDAGGRPLYLIGACTDVTRRKEAENALRASIERFHFVAESMPQKIFTATRTGDVDYLNWQWMEFTGLTFEQLKGRGWLQLIHPEDFEESARLWQHSVDTGEPFQCVHRFRGAGSGYRWHLSRAKPMRDGNGSVSMWIGSNTDIQEQKKTEMELRRLNEDLNYFAFAASHDLQEPLRMIASFSQLLLNAYHGNLDDKAATYVKFITEGTQRMRELLGDLLAYAQVTSGAPATELLDLNGVLAKVMADLKSVIEANDAVVLADPLPGVCILEAHARQLFQNLIGNAIKYRGEAPPRIQVRAHRHGPEWRFAISDNGMGIEPRYHQTIFGVFKRLHGKNIPGTGVGLAICQRVVEQYGGKIWVESQIGQGTTFHFTLPVAPYPAERTRS